MSLTIKTKKRIVLIFFLMAGMLLALTARLVWVQLVRGEELRQKAYAVRFRNVEVKAKRGVIYDAKGKPLAISISTDSFYANPAEVKRSKREKEIAQKIAEVLELEEEKVLELITKNQAFVWINVMCLKRSKNTEVFEFTEATSELRRTKDFRHKFSRGAERFIPRSNC